VANGEKLLERIQSSTNLEFTSQLVEWAPEETSLQLLFRMDLAGELAI
jgi:hypothetical protein